MHVERRAHREVADLHAELAALEPRELDADALHADGRILDGARRGLCKIARRNEKAVRLLWRKRRLGKRHLSGEELLGGQGVAGKLVERIRNNDVVVDSAAHHELVLYEDVQDIRVVHLRERLADHAFGELGESVELEAAHCGKRRKAQYLLQQVDLCVDVAFLDTQVKGVTVNRHTIGERHHLVIHEQRAADGSKPLPVVKHLADGFTFHHLAVSTLQVANGLGVVAPLLQQLQALGKQGGLQWAVLVVRVESWKLVQVLTLGTHLFALSIYAMGHHSGRLPEESVTVVRRTVPDAFEGLHQGQLVLVLGKVRLHGQLVFGGQLTTGAEHLGRTRRDEAGRDDWPHQSVTFLFKPVAAN